MKSKTKNVIRSTWVGIANNVIVAILNFVLRKLFLQSLGLDYLSINQVITSVLAILSFSELGLSNAVLYMLYKPVANNDYDEICRIIKIYRKINQYIGFIVLGMGLACIPFLKYFISTNIGESQLTIAFVLNLVYFSSTYFLNYRVVLLSAYQQDYIVSVINLSMVCIRIIIQCVLLVRFGDYVQYIVCAICVGIAQNILTHYYVGRQFPFLRQQCYLHNIKDIENELYNNIKGMATVKIAGIVINNTDNILVSYIDTLMVGLCSNYLSISIQIKAIISVFQNSLMHSLGIASVTNSTLERFGLFKKIVLINTFLSGAIVVLIGVIWDGIIILWLGKYYVISEAIFWALLINLLWALIIAPSWMFRDTNGLFNNVKGMLLINACVNIILSILMGKQIGVAGVYFATVIASMCTNFWFDIKVVYFKLFEKKDSYKYNIYILLNMFLDLGIVYYFRKKICIDTWSECIVVGGMAFAFYIIVFIILHFRSIAFKEVIEKFKNIKM